MFLSSQRAPLHAAASEGHEYTVKSLVDKGANINIKDKDGVSSEYNTNGMYVRTTNLSRVSLILRHQKKNLYSLLNFVHAQSVHVSSIYLITGQDCGLDAGLDQWTRLLD